MDLKDILTNSENALPTISQAISTGTATSLPTITATPQTYIKTGVSFVLGTVGTCYLMYGKKTADLGKMITGAVLIMMSFFIF